LVIAPVRQVAIEEVFEVGETVRGVGGFGSTGVK
jgi:dUTPase